MMFGMGVCWNRVRYGSDGFIGEDCGMKGCRFGQMVGCAAILASTVAGSIDPASEADEEDRERAEHQARQQQLMEVSCRDDLSRPASWLDLTHSYLNQRLCEPAAWFDGFFGDPRTLEESP